MQVFGALVLFVSTIAVTFVAAHVPLSPWMLSVLVLAAGASSITFLSVVLIRGMRNES